MTQRTQQTDRPAPTYRAGDNPYLEQIMRLIGIGVSLAAAIFTIFSIFTTMATAYEELTLQHEGGLNRVERAVQTEIERYYSDLIGLGNDQGLRGHLVTPNVAAASLRAGEIIRLNPGVYQAVQFIDIRDNVGFLAFERGVLNNTSSSVFMYPVNTTYTAPPESAEAFELASTGVTRDIILGDFYLQDPDAEIPVVMVDAFLPIYTNSNTPVMVIKLQINTIQLRNIVNLAVGDLVDQPVTGDSRRVIWLVGDNRVVADSGSLGVNYLRDLSAVGGNIETDEYYQRLLRFDDVLNSQEEVTERFGINLLYSSVNSPYENAIPLNWTFVVSDNAISYYTPTMYRIFGIVLIGTILPIILVTGIKNVLKPRLDPLYEADTLMQTTMRESTITVQSTGDQAAFINAVRRVRTRINRLSEELDEATARRNRDMQVAGRIGRETATLIDLDTLASRAINLICNELGFYHAQIFLLDDSQTYAVLRYSRGEAGQALIDQGHQLAVGSETVIGTASAEQRAVIVNDTMEGREDPHSFNPLLGETRAEMGLPLLIGDALLGVLDIQSRRPHVFLTQDIPTYQLLADQLAVAIYNAQLREQSNRRIEQIDKLNRQLTRDAWQDLESRLDLKPTYGTPLEEAKIKADISIRGQIVGSLQADLPEGQAFSDADQQILQSVAERVSLAIENARLFQETQTTLAETSVLYELSRQLNEANDLEDVLQAIIVTVARDASGGQVWLFDDTLPGEIPDWLYITVDLPIEQRPEQVYLLGRRVQRSHYPFLQGLSGTEVSAVNDISKSDLMRDDLRQLFESILASSLIIIPLNMRGSWKGFMTISFAERRLFSQREMRIYNALIAQAGVAIDNRLLLQQTEDALARQEKLYAASRIINTSQTLSELVFAAVATASEPNLDFWLALLDGETEQDGWTDETRIIAKSTQGDVQEVNEVYPLFVPSHSPMRQREPEILVDPGEDIQDVPPAVKWMRDLDYKFMAIFPLFSDNAPIALFYIVNREVYDLSMDDYEVYRALTGQMSTQIQNRSLLTQTEQALSEVRRLYVATRAISGAQDTQGIYDAVAGHLALPFIQQSARIDEDLNISMTLLLAQPEPSIEAPQLRYEYHWHSDPTQLAQVETGTVISQEDAPFGMMITNNDDSILIYRNLETVPTDFPMVREILGADQARGAAVAPLWSRSRWFGVLIIRTDQPQLLTEDYTRFMQSIADQVTIAIENQLLLRETQYERQRLDEILATLPVGVMVLDPVTLEPLSTNAIVSQLIGQEILFDKPFSARDYHMYRTGTSMSYPDDELPMYIVRETGEQVVPADDIVIDHGEQKVDLFISAAPIFDSNQNIRAIVAAFQDISTLRSMEYTMQENLRETVMLYETQQGLTEADTLDSLLDGLITQLAMQQTTDIHLLLNHDGELELARSLVQPLPNLDSLRVILSNDEINIADVTQDSTLTEDARQSLTEVGARSVLVMPLKVRTRQQPLGWLMLLDERAEAFGFDQERTLNSIADMTSQTIDNLYLVESTRLALAETESLYNANTSISRARDPEELYHAIDTLLEGLNPDMRAGYVLQGDGQFYEMFKSGFEESEANGLDLQALMTLSLPRSDGLFVADVTRSTLSPFEVEIAKAGNILSFAAINLRIQGEVGGRLLIGYKQPHPFATREERYLSTIADSASVVLDNQSLLGQVQDTLQETSVLYQASKALIDISEPEEIIDVITTHLIEAHINQVFIAMLDRPSWDQVAATVEVVASWQSGTDLDLLGVSFNYEQFPAWAQLATPTVVMINDIYDEQYGLDPMEQTSFESLDTRSVVIMPLRVTSRSIGVIWLGSNQPYQYDERDERIFQAFAEQTSLSLEAKRLLEQTQRRATQLQTSAVISQSVGQILDLDVLLPQVVDLIKQQFKYDHVQVFLMDTENRWAMLRASTGEAGKKLLEIGHRLERGSPSVIGRVTELGEPTIALDTADAEVVHRPNPYLPMTRSEMALPMVVKGEIVGALDVQSNKANAFTDEDVQVLTTLASQIAVAIDNARLYENTQASAENMRFLFDTTSEAASADTLDEALAYVANRVRENSRADVVAMYLPKDYEDYYGNRKQMIEVAAVDSQSDITLNNIPSIELGDVEHMVGMVAVGLRPQIVPNIEKEIRYSPISTQAQSAVIVPITSGVKMVGIIVLESHRLNAYSGDELTLLQALAGSIGAIIQNTLLVEQLQESVEQLREVDRLKSQFLASMSHELRTPLNSIIGFSRVMLKGIDGPLTEMQEQDLNTIYNSGNHLLRLINDILDQAKIEANELNLKFGYFEMKPLVESVKSIAIGLLKEKPELKFMVEVADGLPKVYGDEMRSRQVLLNLVTNAIKFTQEGTVTIDVYAVEGQQGPMIRVDVIDTGMGIAEKDLSTVFEQFRQVDNSLTRTVGGTGLGLPISKSLAEMQGGELTVVSEVNVGSTFSVTIPTYEGAEAELERQQQEKRQKQKPITQSSSNPNNDTATGLISREDVEKAKQMANDVRNKQRQPDATETQEVQKAQSRRIDTNITQNIPMVTQKRDVILVEDDKKMVDQFRRILQREGFEVTTADFPAFAEAMIGQLRPSVVILDVNFANGAGWDLLKNLKERDDTFDIPVVVTTLDEDSERAYRLGAHTFIQRPFLPDDVLEAVLEAEKESQRERILIIDDQPETIRLLTQLLEENSDFKIYSANSGDEGISLVARRRPDLIILDLRMPGKDGFAVLDELRDNPETAKIPVLVVTGEMDLSNAEQEQLVDIHVLRKTDISQEEYDIFLDNVRDYLKANSKKK